MIEEGRITELHNKVNELNTKITEYEEKITVINNAILAIKSKKSQLTTANGDLKAANTWIKNSIESFNENYNGSEIAEKKLGEMKALKRNMKLESNSIPVYINSLDKCIEKLNELKSQYQTNIQNCKTSLSDAKDQIDKYNKGAYVKY